MVCDGGKDNGAWSWRLDDWEGGGKGGVLGGEMEAMRAFGGHWREHGGVEPSSVRDGEALGVFLEREGKKEEKEGRGEEERGRRATARREILGGQTTNLVQRVHVAPFPSPPRPSHGAEPG